MFSLWALWALAGAGACSVDRSGLPVDGEAAPDAADAGDAAPVADVAVAGPDAAADVGGGCTVIAPTSPWAMWPMPDSLAVAGGATPSYDVSALDVVGDRVTHLVWQRAVDAGNFTWTQATTYCACLNLGGYTDWRLPTRIELVSLVDVTRQSPAIDQAAFPDTPSEWFWTSSAAADQSGAAWYVAFFDGDTHHMDRETPYRVRCVRADAPAVPAPRTLVNGDGTVTDRATGLIWQRASEPALLTWADAGAYCAGLGGGVVGADAGATPWRLPTAKELQTLIDETRADPAIDEAAFPGTAGDSFWASSSLAGQDGYAWFVSFFAGVAYNSPTNEPHRARCVR